MIIIRLPTASPAFGGKLIRVTQNKEAPVIKPKCRVLCVDDHRDTSEMLQMLLAEEDYEVQTAATLQEACSMAMQSRYDLYVLDKRLPDGTGLELCGTLQKITPDVPCIFYTGDAYEMHRKEAFEAGAAAFVAKPDIEGLIKAVHQLLTEKECATAS